MKRKTIVLLVAMAAMLALPTTMSAQIDKEGGLFSKKTTEQNNGLLNQPGFRGNATGTISNYGLGEQAPLGSGVVILLLAGAGYVALKKKED